ncbi:uncharacterized protein LOC106457306 isoform X1 [Limulus polyphemus]|uniref:Uncharacterized protein LOC106457306 isoform X1 n=1 Tax=Limulus polyphemus TaxID=6850 RepID=A0ABM1S5H9_LIMPO|nr:uncharacterized protein LOC106457306 isoform X1 [Limulus polyphemus]
MYFQSFVTSVRPCDSRTATSVDVPMTTTGRERNIPLDLSVKQPSRSMKLAALCTSGLSRTKTLSSVTDPSSIHLNFRPNGEEYTGNSAVNVMSTSTLLCSRKSPLPSDLGRRPSSGKVSFLENGEPRSAASVPPYVGPYTPLPVRRSTPTDACLVTNAPYRQVPYHVMNASSSTISTGSYDNREHFIVTRYGGDSHNGSVPSFAGSSQRFPYIKSSHTSRSLPAIGTNQSQNHLTCRTSPSDMRGHNSWNGLIRERNCNSVENHPVGLSVKSYYSSLGGLARLEDDMRSQSNLVQSSQEMYKGQHSKQNGSVGDNLPPALPARPHFRNSKNTVNEVIVIDDDPEPTHISQESKVKVESTVTQLHAIPTEHSDLPIKRHCSTEDNEANIKGPKMPRLVAFCGNKSSENDGQANVILYPDPPALTAAVVTIATTKQTGMLNNTSCSSPKVTVAPKVEKKCDTNYNLTRDPKYLYLSKNLQKGQEELNVNVNNVSQEQACRNVILADFSNSLNDSVQDTSQEINISQEFDTNESTSSLIGINSSSNDALLSKTESLTPKSNMFNQITDTEGENKNVLHEHSLQVSSVEMNNLSSFVTTSQTILGVESSISLLLPSETHDLSRQNMCTEKNGKPLLVSVSSPFTQRDTSSGTLVPDLTQNTYRSTSITNPPMFNNVSGQVTHIDTSNESLQNEILSNQKTDPVFCTEPDNNTSLSRPISRQILNIDKNSASLLKPVHYHLPCIEANSRSLISPVHPQALYTEANNNTFLKPLLHQVSFTEKNNEPLLNSVHHQVLRVEESSGSLLSSVQQHVSHSQVNCGSLVGPVRHQVSHIKTNSGPLLNPIHHQVLRTEVNNRSLPSLAYDQVPYRKDKVSNAPLSSLPHQNLRTSTNSEALLQPSSFQVRSTDVNIVPVSNLKSRHVTQIQANNVSVLNTVSPVPNMKATNMPILNRTSDRSPGPTANNTNYGSPNVDLNRTVSSSNTSYTFSHAEVSKRCSINNICHQVPCSETSGIHMLNNTSHQGPALFNTSYLTTCTNAKRLSLLNNTSDPVILTETSNNTTVLNNNSHLVLGSQVNRPSASNSTFYVNPGAVENKPPLLPHSASRQTPVNEINKTLFSNSTSSELRTETDVKLLSDKTFYQVFSAETNRKKLENGSSSHLPENQKISLLKPVVHQTTLHTQTNSASEVNNIFPNRVSSSENTSKTTPYQILNATLSGIPVWKFAENLKPVKTEVHGKMIYRKSLPEFTNYNKLRSSQTMCTVGSGNIQPRIVKAPSSPGLKEVLLQTSKNSSVLIDSLNATSKTPMLMKSTVGATVETKSCLLNNSIQTSTGSFLSSLEIQTNKMFRTTEGSSSSVDTKVNDHLNVETTSSLVLNNNSIKPTNTKSLLKNTVLHKLLSCPPSESPLPNTNKNMNSTDLKKTLKPTTKTNDRKWVGVKWKPGNSGQEESDQPTKKYLNGNGLKHQTKPVRKRCQTVQPRTKARQRLRKITRSKQKLAALRDKDRSSTEKHVSTRAQQRRHQFVDFQPRVLGVRTRNQTGLNGNLSSRSCKNNNKYTNVKKRENEFVHEVKSKRNLRKHLLKNVYVEEKGSGDESIARKPEEENADSALKLAKTNTPMSRCTSSWQSKQKKQNGRHAVRRKRLKSGLDMIPKPYKRKKTKPVKSDLPVNEELTDAFSLENCKEERTKTKYDKISFDFSNGAPLEMKRIMVNKALGETVLHRASRLGYLEAVFYCLETNYCDVNARDNAGYTPLHECCSRGNLEIANALVQHGSDVSASAVGGIRPLHDAVENDQLEIVRLLLSHGADPLIATYSGLTPLKLCKSAVLEEFFKGYMNDLSGQTDTLWRFPGSATCLDVKEVGYDIWEGLPSDSENEAEDKDDFVFEVSDTPHLPTFRVRLPGTDNRILSNCIRLTDVLRQIGLTKEEFVQFYRNIEIFSIPKHEFDGSATCRQLGTDTKLDPLLISSEDSEKTTVDVLNLSNDVREVLGIEIVTLR